MIIKPIDRRTLIKRGSVLLLVCAGAGLGPLLARNRKVFRKAIIVMGTIAEIQIVHDDAQKAHAIMAQAFAEIQRIEQSMSRFRNDSEVSRANSQAFHHPIAISQETAGVLSRAFHWARATRGMFDPGIGKLSKIWNIKHRNEPPEGKRLSRLANRQFYQQLRLDREGGKCFLQFSSKDVQLDLGGIAKGYAADRAIDVLAHAGIEQALVNLGGDVVALGGKNKNHGWKVGVKDPNHPHQIAKILELKNQAVATSGNYEQYFISQSSLYHHLIDPRLARPGRSIFHGLTVIGPNGCDADALATGLFFFSKEKTQQLLESHTEGFTAVRFG
ncbi:MAG: FAD:protein FMN transferase [SAR324 cluster bacterium]|nr:FAD:protein FMN transferase [SAR324 cluster bacterium]